MKLYVGNLAYSVTDSDLQTMFSTHGTSARRRSSWTGDSCSKGFGFVEMDSGDQARGHERLERSRSGRLTLTVNEAKPREDRGGSRGGYGR